MPAIWEYKLIHSTSDSPVDLEAKLNAAAEEGWEPIFYQATPVGAGRFAQLTMMRRPSRK